MLKSYWWLFLLRELLPLWCRLLCRTLAGFKTEVTNVTYSLLMSCWNQVVVLLFGTNIFLLVFQTAKCWWAIRRWRGCPFHQKRYHISDTVTGNNEHWMWPSSLYVCVRCVRTAFLIPLFPTTSKPVAENILFMGCDDSPTLRKTTF